ncbi:hypothetical protein RUND412_010608 [Rhizina undulata]
MPKPPNSPSFEVEIESLTESSTLTTPRSRAPTFTRLPNPTPIWNPPNFLDSDYILESESDFVPGSQS